MHQHLQLWCVGNIENNIAVYFTGLRVISKACKRHEGTLINVSTSYVILKGLTNNLYSYSDRIILLFYIVAADQ